MSSSIDQRAIFEGMTRTLPVLAFVVDADGVFREIIANGYTDDFLFDEPANVIGNSITTLFADDKAELFEENIDQALQTGAVQEFEYSLSIDGKHRTFAGYMAPMDEDMDEELVIWIAEDITERKRQHDRLVKAETLANMGGWEYIPETDTVKWTEGTKRIFEVSDTFEPTLSNATNFYHETDQPLIEEAIKKCLENGVQYSLDTEVVTDEGRQRWIHNTGKREIEDGVTKLSGLIRDVTRRKTREQRLEVLNRVLRHNLRNELSQVQGYAEMVEEQLPAGAEEFHSKIVESADRLLSLAEQSKKFDTAMEYNYVTGPVDVKSILEDLCVEYREKYPDATIETELGDAQAPGNDMAVKLIFEELIENALKHNDGDHPTVNLIVASPEPNRIDITIADNGPGLNEVEQQVIRANEETALQHSLGIGLWTTSWLVSELSGDIQLTTTEGEGTSITITIPGEKSE